jgi:hypothetical protein
MSLERHSIKGVRTLLERLDEETFYAFDELYSQRTPENALVQEKLVFYEDLLEQLQVFRERLDRIESDEHAVDAFRELEAQLEAC